MADSTNIVDGAADTANTWWQWGMSFVPERWKKYVALVMFALALLWILPTLVGAVRDTMGYLYQPPQVSDFEAKAHQALLAHSAAIAELRQRMSAIENKAPPPPADPPAKLKR